MKRRFVWEAQVFFSLAAWSFYRRNFWDSATFAATGFLALADGWFQPKEVCK